jgi:hypothetical protein
LGGCGGNAFAAFLTAGFAFTPVGFSIASCVDFESPLAGITPGLPSPAQPVAKRKIKALKNGTSRREFNSNLLKYSWEYFGTRPTLIIYLTPTVRSIDSKKKP